MAPTSLVLVSHSVLLAEGCAEVARQMAPDVLILPAGGTDEGGLGTSYDLVSQSVRRTLDGGAREVVLLGDLGSAVLTATSVQEMLADERVLVAEAPFVEGAVAAAVAAQAGDGGAPVREAAQRSVEAFPGAPAPGGSSGAEAPPGEPLRRLVQLRNRMGLHARPAAMLARRAVEFDARLLVNGVDATSVLALMGLGLTAGAEIELEAVGPQAEQVLETISAEVEAGFGEE